jgi:hypothetical protein
MVGERPTHPKLLDYLAMRFVNSGWSLKATHRLIMLSSTYQMSSELTRKKMATDPSNLLWSRFNSRRLEVEEIRDALLAVDGSLDLTMGGTLQTGSGHDRENDPVARVSMDPAKSRRRTVYLPLRRSNLSSFLTTFDFGDATTTGEERASTSIAPHALFMMNSAFVAERSRSFAKYVLGTARSNDARRIEQAYLLALTRKPTAEEVKADLRYIDGFGKMVSGLEAKMAAWQSFCRTLMASNEFIYVN